MQRIILALYSMVCLFMSEGAWAKAPLHFIVGFPEVPVPVDTLSDACGFDVFLTFDGIAHGTLFYDQNGTPVREIDRASGVKATLSSDFDSLRTPLASFHTTYEGDANGDVTIGSPATVELVGFSLNPRSPSAGKVVFSAVVVDFNENGVPITDFLGPPIFVAGHADDFEAICVALD